MAETLGSLIDKLSIKSIREFHLRKMRASKEVSRKLKILARQKDALLGEVEEFIARAIQGKARLKDEKLKLYNKPQMLGKIGKMTRLSKAIDALTRKNMQLWDLEDEARREDVSLACVGRTKRKIDLANQQRNDLIDKIDDLLEDKVSKSKRSKRRAK